MEDAVLELHIDKTYRLKHDLELNRFTYGLVHVFIVNKYLICFEY